jgi:hypothetical protein
VRFIGLGVEIRAKPIQAPLPSRSSLADPTFGLFKHLRFELAGTHPTRFC